MVTHEGTLVLRATCIAGRWSMLLSVPQDDTGRVRHMVRASGPIPPGMPSRLTPPHFVRCLQGAVAMFDESQLLIGGGA